MKIDLFDRSRIPLLEKQLDALSLRNKAIASNIANIGTPNYKRLDVSFENELSDAISEANNSVDLSNNVEQVEPEMGVDRASLYFNGANNIDIDHEMAELAKNQLQFGLVSKLVAGTFQSIDKSINGEGQ
ncbi:MAG TPA: flagellar basal body rod protein FlgB [Candidatus Acidoferrales bacterium]|nr:flagellar basal body rod protein FlgB [Candidatus Acidoferrales bacterium]